MEYTKLFGTLQQHQVKYLVCGELAVNIYGVPRMTADIDLLLDFSESNISHFETALKVLLYKNVIPLPFKNLVHAEERKKAISEKNRIAYSFFNSQAGYVNLDVLLDVPLQFEYLWENKTVKTLENIDINLVSINDLITLKNYANRKQDQDDVVLLSKLIK